MIDASFREAVLEAADHQCQYVGTQTEWEHGATRCQERGHLHIYRSQPDSDDPRTAVAVCSRHYQMTEQYVAKSKDT